MDSCLEQLKEASLLLLLTMSKNDVLYDSM